MTKKEIGYVIPSFKGRRHEVPRGTERQIQNKANFLINIFTLIYLTDIHAQRVENLNLTWLGWGI